MLTLLTAAHVPCAPVRAMREVVNHPHLPQRGMWIDVEHRRRGKRRVPISPIRLHGSAPAAVDCPPPCPARTLTGYCPSSWACARTSWPHCTRGA
jgi:CoA:oxalate CoA-transferase